MNYSVEFAVAFDKPHPYKEYHLEFNKWKSLPYDAQEDVSQLAKYLNSLIKEETDDLAIVCTEVIIEVLQKEKLKTMCLGLQESLNNV